MTESYEAGVVSWPAAPRSPRLMRLTRGLVLSGCALLALAMLTNCRRSEPAPHAERVERAVPAPVAQALPVIAPVEYRPVTVDEALAINAEPAVPERAGPAARPFVVTRPAAALDCLTSAVYYEAASESDDGERAVAQVVLNRVRHPAFPASVCGVVYQGAERTTGCQFTFACDGALLRTPSAAGWRRARRIAGEALQGHVFKPVGNATHYHANWVVPYWASSLNRAATIGVHIFYRWSGSWGMPRAFFQRYAGIEPDISASIARWTKAGAPGALAAADAPLLLEDAKLAARPARPEKPQVLAADLASGGLVARLRKTPRLEADRGKARLKIDADRPQMR